MHSEVQGFVKMCLGAAHFHRPWSIVREWRCTAAFLPTPSFVFCVCVVQAVCACCWGEGAHTHVWRSTGKRLRSRVFLFNSPPSFLKPNNSVSLSQLSLLSSLWALEPTCFCLLAREAQQWDTYLCSCCGFKLRSPSCSTEQTGIYSQCVKEEHW